MSRNHNKHRARKRAYDPLANKYELTARELANLAIGAAANAELAAVNTARVYKLACSGRSAADIMLITGLSRATVYRAMRRALDVPAHDEFVWPAPDRDPLLL